jgi:hypothetical protein
MQSILTLGLVLLVCSMVFHIIIWRSLPIRNEASRLALLFIALPAAIILFCVAAPSSWRMIPQWPWAVWCLVYLMDLSASLSYMVLYTAITGFSPSIAILEHVEESMPKGLPREELVPGWFTHERLAGARHHNLVSHRLVSDSGGILQLQPRGRFVAQCFLIFRRFLGLPDSAGG